MNFEILFLVFSFFVNLYFSSRGTCAEEKCKFVKNDFSTKNKILKFEIAKNIKTKNVLSVKGTNMTVFVILFSRHLYPTRQLRAWLKFDQKKSSARCNIL